MFIKENIFYNTAATHDAYCKPSIRRNILGNTVFRYGAIAFSTLVLLCKLLSVSSGYILMKKTDEQTYNTNKIERIISGIDEKYLPYTEDILTTLMKIIHISEK